MKESRASAPRRGVSAAALALGVIIAFESAARLTAPWCSGWFNARLTSPRSRPTHRRPSMTYASVLDDCRLRRCRQEGRPPVIFLGGSPTSQLDAAYLDERFASAAGGLLILTYPTGAYPLELLALQDSLTALRPRALVLGVGPRLFTYRGLFSTRLAFFPLTRRVLRRLPGGVARCWRLVVRTVMANGLAAFRYRFLLRNLLLPPEPGNPETEMQRYERPQDLFQAAAGDIAMDRRQGEEMLESFLDDWRGTGIPLIVWDAPTLDRDDGDLAYLRLMNRLSGAYGFRFIGPEDEPRFVAEEFRNHDHLRPDAAARMTRFLAREVERALSRSAGGAAGP